jgi:flavin reductase (DIM6/NTAB) family NADH-FMN oxidoreductase RutF
MNATSGPWGRDVDEFTYAGIERAPCTMIAASRVAQAPAALECRMTQIVQLAGAANFVVFGEVVGVHLRPDCVVDGRFDILRFNPLARCGYRDYASVTNVFSLSRPKE